MKFVYIFLSPHVLEGEGAIYLTFGGFISLLDRNSMWFKSLLLATLGGKWNSKNIWTWNARALLSNRKCFKILEFPFSMLRMCLPFPPGKSFYCCQLVTENTRMHPNKVFSPVCKHLLNNFLGLLRHWKKQLMKWSTVSFFLMKLFISSDRIFKLFL